MTLRASSPATVPAALRQRRKEARPKELLDAALDLFVEKGFAATRSEEVASRAGVSKGTLYLYYPSKEELLKEVIRHNVVNQIAEGMEIVRAFEGSASELLAYVLHLWWERVGETRASGILKLMMSEVRNFPEIAQFWVDEVTSPADRMIAEIVQRGIDSGEFRQVNDVENAVHALVGAAALPGDEQAFARRLRRRREVRPEGGDRSPGRPGAARPARRAPAPPPPGRQRRRRRARQQRRTAMKRWQGWTIAVVAVVALGGFVARALVAKQERPGGADRVGEGAGRARPRARRRPRGENRRPAPHARDLGRAEGGQQRRRSGRGSPPRSSR